MFDLSVEKIVDVVGIVIDTKIDEVENEIIENKDTIKKTLLEYKNKYKTKVKREKLQEILSIEIGKVLKIEPKKGKRWIVTPKHIINNLKLTSLIQFPASDLKSSTNSKKKVIKKDN